MKLAVHTFVAVRFVVLEEAVVKARGFVESHTIGVIVPRFGQQRKALVCNRPTERAAERRETRGMRKTYQPSGAVKWYSG